MASAEWNGVFQKGATPLTIECFYAVYQSILFFDQYETTTQDAVVYRY
jgi:hypothetical protein